MLDTNDINALLKELQLLNPSVIMTYQPHLEEGVIRASVPGWKLKLPKPFYFNDKNGITNKHETRSGLYITVEVLPLK